MPKIPSGIILLQHVDRYKVRQARDLRRTMTPAERLVWQRVRDNRIAGVKFRRQQVIEGFVADFFCHKAKLVVEIDGEIHDTEDRKKEDERRTTVFAGRGLEEIRFRNDEVLSGIDKVIGKITEKVISRLEIV